MWHYRPVVMRGKGEAVTLKLTEAIESGESNVVWELFSTTGSES
jgi:hypothetical protein